MTRPDTSARPDLYARITDTIIAQLETGVRPWTQPWTASASISRPLRHSGEAYSGINILLLWSEATARGYEASTWMTFRQALALGGCVRRGETGTTVVYANTLARSETDEGGEEHLRRIPFLKAYTVFNVEQIEGLDPAYAPKPAPAVNPETRIAAIETWFAGLGVDVRHGGGCAFYRPASDHVQMPPFERFHDALGYYATLGHECVHWTGHPDRLARDFSRSTHAYAREELVAELGAAFLCADLGLTLEPREDHASYLGSWLEVLRGDRRFIVSAAAQAQRAVDWLHGPR